MKRPLAVALAILLLGMASPAALPSGPPGDAENPFPLSKGTYWIYRGVVRWTRVGSGQVSEKTLTWKMEVMETLDRNRIRAAVIRGHPADLAWYEDGKGPGNYLVIGVGAKKFYLLQGGPRRSAALLRLRDDRDQLNGLVGEDELFLDFPLTPGKAFGEAEQLARQDGFYSWRVERKDEARLRHIKGLSQSRKLVRYRLSFRTLPDHVIIDFVPAVGITRYVYVHHGTVSEADLRLIEFRPGGK